MRRAGIAAMLLTVLALPAAAQPFPLDRPFKVVSISGFDVQKAAMTLQVVRDGGGMRASGHAGCNRWTANAVIRDEEIVLTEITTTRIHCGAPRMKSEEAFLSSLRSAQRWRVDDKGRLIIEGDAARLLLAPGAPDSRKKRSGRTAPQVSRSA